MIYYLLQLSRLIALRLEMLQLIHCLRCHLWKLLYSFCWLLWLMYLHCRISYHSPLKLWIPIPLKLFLFQQIEISRLKHVQFSDIQTHAQIRCHRRLRLWNKKIVQYRIKKLVLIWNFQNKYGNYLLNRQIYVLQF